LLSYIEQLAFEKYLKNMEANVKKNNIFFRYNFSNFLIHTNNSYMHAFKLIKQHEKAKKCMTKISHLMLHEINNNYEPEMRCSYVIPFALISGP